MLSSLFDNKQIIHIATEVVALIAVTFYFSSKNKKLQADIEGLAQRLEEQENRLEKLENILSQLTGNIQNTFNQMGQKVNSLSDKLDSCVATVEQQATRKHIRPTVASKPAVVVTSKLSEPNPVVTSNPSLTSKFTVPLARKTPLSQPSLSQPSVVQSVLSQLIPPSALGQPSLGQPSAQSRKVSFSTRNEVKLNDIDEAEDTYDEDDEENDDDEATVQATQDDVSSEEESDSVNSDLDNEIQDELNEIKKGAQSSLKKD